MKRILIALFVLMTCFPLYGQDVVLPYLIILDWLQADSINVRSMTVTSAIDLESSVSGKLVVADSARVEKTLRVKGAITAGATATPTIIQANGYVGILATPSYPLHVAGDAYVTGDVTMTSGNVVGMSSSSSSIRFNDTGLSGAMLLLNGSKFLGATSATSFIGTSLGSNKIISKASGTASLYAMDLLYEIDLNATVSSGTMYGYFLNATETNLRGLNHYLMDLQVGSVSKFNVKNNGTVTTVGATNYRMVVSLADGAQHLLPTGVAGFGQVKAIGAWCFFHFAADGTVTLEDHVSGSTTEDNDTTLNVFDDGSGIGIENELGSTLNVLIDITYYTP